MLPIAQGVKFITINGQTVRARGRARQLRAECVEGALRNAATPGFSVKFRLCV